MASTLHDVAKLAGVSFKTVSNVVNEYPYVRDTTRQRVLSAIRELDYQPNSAARALRSGRTGVIGIAVPELELPYFATLTAEVIVAAERRGLTVLIEQTNRDRRREIEALTSPRRQMTDGLLFSPLALGPEDAALLHTEKPVVLLGENLFTPGTDHVTMQNVEGARAATEYLLELGHRRIAAIGVHEGEVVGSAGLRLTGYRQAHAARGLPVDEKLLQSAGPWHRRDGAEAVQRLLEGGVEFDAVFAFNDTLALGAIHTLQAAGLDVPGDVSVIGFDDVEEGEYSMPTLTTLDAGRRQIAELAVDSLVARLANPDAPIRHIEVKFQVIQRASTRAR